MSTITYGAQPGISKTKGSIPLAGTSHVYTVSKLLWASAVTEFLETQLIEPTLHLCCGKSMLGSIRLDLYEKDVDIRADAARVPFATDSFNTVLIDPPYNGVFQWNHDMISEVGRIASKRFIFQHWFSPVNIHGRFKKDHSFYLSGLYAWMPRTYFGRMQIISVFDRDYD
jgi:hypothetical protein